MQRDRIATARIWLSNAEENLNLASDVASRYPSLACSHAQQTSELALKAALIAIADDHPRTHVGGALVDELRAIGESVPEDVAAGASRLDLIYMNSRYPDSLGGADPLRVLGEVDAVSALIPARRVLAFATSIIDREARANGSAPSGHRDDVRALPALDQVR